MLNNLSQGRSFGLAGDAAAAAAPVPVPPELFAGLAAGVKVVCVRFFRGDWEGFFAVGSEDIGRLFKCWGGGGSSLATVVNCNAASAEGPGPAAPSC